MRRRSVPGLAAAPVALLTLVALTTSAPAQEAPEGAAAEPPRTAKEAEPSAETSPPPPTKPEQAAEKPPEKAPKKSGTALRAILADAGVPLPTSLPGGKTAGAGEPATELQAVARYARGFFTQLLAGDTRAMAARAAYPFQLEEQRVLDAESFVDEWNQALKNKRTELLTLYGIDVYTPAEMEKKYGKPPERLANLPWKAPRTYVAVANLSGRAAVAILREAPGKGWLVVGYHD